MTPRVNQPGEEELVEVELLMSSGERYSFPGVQWRTIWLIIRDENLLGLGQLSLVNRQMSCLTVQTPNLAQILIDGEVFWSRTIA